MLKFAKVLTLIMGKKSDSLKMLLKIDIQLFSDAFSVGMDKRFDEMKKYMSRQVFRIKTTCME